MLIQSQGRSRFFIAALHDQYGTHFLTAGFTFIRLGISNPGRMIPEAAKPAAAPVAAAADEDDFFNTWNEPKKPTSGTSTPMSSSTPPPVLGMASAASPRAGLVRPQR